MYSRKDKLTWLRAMLLITLEVSQRHSRTYRTAQIYPASELQSERKALAEAMFHYTSVLVAERYCEFS